MRAKLAALEHRIACTWAQSLLAEAPPGAVVGPLVVPTVAPGCTRREHWRSMPGALQYFMEEAVGPHGRRRLWTRSWQPRLRKACAFDQPVGALKRDPPLVHSLGRLYLDGISSDPSRPDSYIVRVFSN